MANEKMTTSGVTYTPAGDGYFESARWCGPRASGACGASDGRGDLRGLLRVELRDRAAGWGGLGIAAAVIIVMYFGMLLSIGEMSAAMPHTGGAYSFARAAMGPWGGFITGFAETIEYVFTTAVVVYFSASYADAVTSDLFGISLPGWLWWIILYAIFVGLNSWGAEVSFRFALVVAIISIGILVLFAVLALAHGAVDFGRLLDIEPDPAAAGSNSLLPFGFLGVLYALPFAMWFFLGIEELPLPPRRPQPEQGYSQGRHLGHGLAGGLRGDRLRPQPGGDRVSGAQRVRRATAGRVPAFLPSGWAAFCRRSRWWACWPASRASCTPTAATSTRSAAPATTRNRCR